MGSSSNHYLRQSSRLTLAHLGYIRPNARDCAPSLKVRLLFFLWDLNAFSFVVCKKHNNPIKQPDFAEEDAFTCLQKMPLSNGDTFGPIKIRHQSRLIWSARSAEYSGWVTQWLGVSPCADLAQLYWQIAWNNVGRDLIIFQYVCLLAASHFDKQ